MMGELGRNIVRIFLLLVITILIGTVAYRVVEGRDWFDCLYMTVITVTTTGYGEIWNLSFYGRLISMFLMFFGVGIFFYSISLITPMLFEMKLRRWEKMLEGMSDHCIICGYGLMGREIAKHIPKEEVVIVDIDINKVELAREDGYVSIHGDATDESTLDKAKVRDARSIVCCMTDSSNAFAVITAKALNPNVKTFVVLRNPDAERKMKRIGVDFLLSPYKDTAMKVYALMRSRASVEFVETVMGKIVLEKVTVDERFAGKTLRELDLRRRTGCTVIAIVRDSEIIVPSAETRLEMGDVMFVMGKDLEDLLRL